MPWLILLFIMAAGGGYAYHTTTVAKLESTVVQLEANNRTLKENQFQLENAVATAQESARALEENAQRTQAAMTQLSQRNNELQREKDNAMRIFRDHNLTRLARAKPGMIETRANKKTAEVFRDLENDTKELMDADDSEPTTPGVQLDASSGVGAGAADSSSGTSNNNG